MFDRASLKLGLDKAVLQSMGSKDFNSVGVAVAVVAVVANAVADVVVVGVVAADAVVAVAVIVVVVAADPVVVAASFLSCLPHCFHCIFRTS